MRRAVAALAGWALLAVLLAGCGGSSSPGFTTPGAARTFRLADLRPSAPARAGMPVVVSFVIRQPDGSPLTTFRHGPGPHTGVHLILVRRDLSMLIHRHPPISADGTISQTVTFPSPGAYRLVVDVYPASGPQVNFQLFGTVRVAGAYHPRTFPVTTSPVVVGGYRFTLSGASKLRAIDAALVTVTVTGPGGKVPRFRPWYGALAHAIFFREGSLDYFHTHVCAPGATGCTSVLGPRKVTGRPGGDGKLGVGVLVPTPGIWRLFLQCRIDGKILTAPFTLQVR